MGTPVFTSDWFSNKIPQWKQQLKPMHDLARPIRALEIGSYEGRSALWLLDRFKDQGITLDCVDVWQDENIYTRFQTNTQEAIRAERLRFHRASSFSQLCKFGVAQQRYDFIYIDGGHYCPTVLSDAIMAFRLLTIGGKMCFDDYKWTDGNSAHLPPKPAIDAFLTCYGKYLLVTLQKYQVWIQKTHEVP